MKVYEQILEIPVHGIETVDKLTEKILEDVDYDKSEWWETDLEELPKWADVVVFSGHGRYYYAVTIYGVFDNEQIEDMVFRPKDL